MVSIKKVVIPIDFSSNMGKVVDYGMSIADSFGADVHFLHVVDDFQGYDMMLVHPSFRGMTDDLKEQAEVRMKTLIKDHNKREGAVTGAVTVGYATDEIINYAKSIDADMIIIGTHGAKGLERVLMGSTASQVVKKSPCPVLVFNPFT